MSERRSSGEVSRSRKVFEDVTNNFGKRRLPLVPGKFVIGNGIGIGNHLENKPVYSEAKKRVCRGPDSLFRGEQEVGDASSFPENLERGNWVTRSFTEPKNDMSKKILPPLKKGVHQLSCSSFNDNAGHTPQVPSSQVAKKAKELSVALNPGFHFIRGNVAVHGVTTGARLVKGSCASGTSAPLQCDKTGNACATIHDCHERTMIGSADVTESSMQADGSSVNKCEGELNGLSPSSLEFTSLNEKITSGSENATQELLDNFCMESSVEPSTSSGHKTFNLNKPSSSYEHHSCNASGVACSCIFCRKAYYRWADLLYQDAQDRLIELKKSRKEASNSVAKSDICDPTRGSLENFTTFARLEFDLAQRWRSLFLRTENALLCEGAQLRTNILKLKELRENCKRNLYVVGGIPSGNLPGAPVDSD